MGEIYHASFLVTQHVNRFGDVADIIPSDIQPKDFSTAVLSLLKESNDVETLKNRIIEIASNNEVNPEQCREWEHIEKELDELVAAIITAKLAAKNHGGYNERSKLICRV